MPLTADSPLSDRPVYRVLMCLSSGALWESGSGSISGLVFCPSAFNAQHIHVSKDNFGFMACEIPRLTTSDNKHNDINNNNNDNVQSDAMWAAKRYEALH